MATQNIAKTGTTPLKAAPLPPAKRYRCRLETIQHVRKEMARLYREGRSELIDPAKAAKLAWILMSIGKIIETSDLERRVEELEELQK